MKPKTNAQQQLLDLIKVLDKSDKKSITQKIKSTNKTPDYLRLYAYMEKCIVTATSYDREKAIKSLKVDWDNKKIGDKESYLYDQLLIHLSNKYIAKSHVKKVNQYISEAEMLRNKGLYHNCIERLKRVKKIAYAHHKYALIIETIPKEVDVILLLKKSEKIDRKSKVEKAYEEMRDALRITTQEATYRKLNVSLFLEFQEHRNSNLIPASIKKDYSSLINQGFPENGSFYAQYYFYSIQAIWARLHQKTKEAYHYQKKVVVLWQQNKLIKDNNIQSYLTQLDNLCNYATEDKNFEAAQEVIDLLSTVVPQNEDEEAEKVQVSLFREQYLLINQNKFEAVTRLIPRIDHLFQTHLNKVTPSRYYSLCYNTLICFLLLAEYDEAQHWLEKLFRFLDDNKESRQDLEPFIYILQFMIVYSQDSDEFTQSMFRKLNRRKELKDRMKDFEKRLLKFFREALNTIASPKAHQQLLQELLSDLNNYTAIEKKQTGYEETVEWVKMLLNKTP